ncbi:MAG: fibronectin type III domain-containing protein [Planctomycetota bacterium]|nr:fibronectin type III domain-containing protein [Planctomycetota bacterium]
MGERISRWLFFGMAWAVALTLTVPVSSQGKGGGGGGKPPKGSDDTDPPPAVTDLGTGLVTTNSVELLWTASRDDTGDEGSGAADSYDVRYSTDPITDANWGSATQAQGEPTPQAPGSPETFTVSGLLPGGTYYLRLKVADEVPNISDLSNEGSALTDTGNWSIEVVDSGVFYNALAFDPLDGNPSIAYGSDTEANFADWNGSSWDIEHVDSGATDVDHGYNSGGVPGMAYLKGGNRKKKLIFAERAGSSWTFETVDSGLSAGIELSLAYDDNGNPALAYENNGLKFAHWNGSSFDIETVDNNGVRPSFASLAYGGSGNPAIAYRFQYDDGTEALKYASWNGSSWDIEDVERGGRFKGFRANLAFDPITGHPSIVHLAGPSCSVRELRFAGWDGTQWNFDIIDSGPDCVSSPSLAYDAAGTPHVAYGKSLPGIGDLRYAVWDGLGWVVEIVQSLDGGGARPSLAVDSGGVPALSYRDADTSAQLRFARKNNP